MSTSSEIAKRRSGDSRAWKSGFRSKMRSVRQRGRDEGVVQG